MVRRGVMLELYTGQRGSDAVRLGPTFIDDGGFDLSQIKTGRPVWCPILPELAAEIATWERKPGPYLLQDHGKPFTRKLLSKHFNEQAQGHSRTGRRHPSTGCAQQPSFAFAGRALVRRRLRT